MKIILLFTITSLLMCSCKEAPVNTGSTFRLNTNHDDSRDEKISRLKSSISYISSLVKRHPKDSVLYLDRGQTYMDLAETSGWLYYYKLSINDFTEAIKINGKYADAYYLRAKCFEQFENDSAAVRDYEAIHKIHPETYDIYDKLEYLYGKLNNEVKAEKYRMMSKKTKQKMLRVYEKKHNRRFPRTVEEAVDFLMRSLDPGVQEAIKQTNYQDLIKYHFGLGMYIRNEFGLWAGNYALLKSCGSADTHPDNASMVIIQALWNKLQGDKEKFWVNKRDVRNAD